MKHLHFPFRLQVIHSLPPSPHISLCRRGEEIYKSKFRWSVRNILVPDEEKIRHKTGVVSVLPCRANAGPFHCLFLHRHTLL